MDIAIIDDSRSVLLELNSAISSFRGVVTHLFTDPIEALARSDDTYFDLVLVDFVMPGLNGIEVVSKLRGKPHYRNIPIVMVTSERDREVKIQAIEAGATDFLSKPFDAVELKARVGNLLDLRAAQLGLERKAHKLEATVETVMRDVVAREEEIIWRLARAVEYRDGNTGSHVSRVAGIARLIAVDLGFDEGRAHVLSLAAPLHDIGKIGVADSVLLKPGRLSPEEIVEMRRHVEIGVKILENGTSRLVQVACRIAAGHHEKWDGTGYPRGLAGEDIPIEARIVAVADVFEALCSERPYKRAWSINDAYREILAGSGAHFDPACVAAFERCWPEIRQLMHEDVAQERLSA